MEGGEAIGKCFIIYSLHGSKLGWVHAGLEKEEMWGQAVKRCLVFPQCNAQLLHSVLIVTSIRLCHLSWQESTEHIQQMHLHPVPGCPIRVVAQGNHSP